MRETAPGLPQSLKSIETGLSSSAAETSERDLAASAPAHLLTLRNDEWALWRCICVRGAGFPVDLVLQLAAPACADAADQLIRAEQARDDAVLALRNRLSLLAQKYDKDGDEQEREKLDRQQAVLSAALRALKQKRLPQPVEERDSDCQEVETLRAACLQLDEARRYFQQAFASATLAVSQALHRIARAERFREAVLWQNRLAVSTGIDELLRYQPEETSQQSKLRTKEALVANYLQRYATKNDTIGFFGPVGCGRLVTEGEALTVDAGSSLLASRKVYFENWAIEALAAALAQDERLKPWFVPRPMPHTHLDGDRLLVPFAKPLVLPDAQATVLRACDGKRTAKEIALDLLASAAQNVSSEEDVYRILEELSSAKRVLWTLEIQAEGAYPEADLRRLLKRIDDEALRRLCLEKLARLEAARDAVARAAGQSAQLNEAMSRLEATFVELTGAAPTRSGGKAYAARTLIYEDCLRALKLDLGPEFLQALEQPLTLFLLSARWFTYHIAALYRQAFLDGYAELVEQAGSSIVDFASFWLWIQPLLVTDDERLVDDLVPVFQERWTEIFEAGEHSSDRHWHFTSEELLPRVLEAFDAPGPGWRAACYHSPDILIQASSVEAMRAGDYQLVLGEFHIAMNTLQIMTFFMQYPAPQDILEQTMLDLPEPRILPVFSRQYLPFTRVRPFLTTAKDFRLVYSPDACSEPGSQTLLPGELVIERQAETLMVRTRDGRCQFDVIEVFAEFFSRLVVGCFKMFPPQKHRPRISVDRMIVARESWSFAPSELTFATEKTPAERFLACRRWVQEHHMPRFVFTKVPGEQKPCFVDFTSSVSIDIFARMVRQSRESNPLDVSITLSEMLPEPDQCWLPDNTGARYTSELRLVAVDQVLPEQDW